jgi:hypothetical protein
MLLDIAMLLLESAALVVLSIAAWQAVKAREYRMPPR